MLENLIFQSTASKPVPVPTTPGEIYEGGYYAGRIRVADKVYALILSPRAQGAMSAVAWGLTNNPTPGTSSFNDGWANTQAMIALGENNFPAAKFCNDLVINGFDDWYLPSVDELEILYRNFKPTTIDNNISTTNKPHGANGANPNSVPIGAPYTSKVPAQTPLIEFQIDNSESLNTSAASSLWSSTESTINTAYPWMQNFNNGLQTVSIAKTGGSSVRAIRRVLITE